MYRRLVEHLSLPKTPAQVALSSAALLSFLRLQPYRSSRKDEVEANHLSDFHSLLEGSPSSKARETLEHASWSFWIVISDGIDAAEGQKISQLLACVLDTTSIPDCPDKDLVRYWKSKFNTARSHNDALSTIPDVSEKFALPVKSDPPALNTKRSTIESEIATDGSSQVGANRSSEYLVQSKIENVSRRRGCWGWRWF